MDQRTRLTKALLYNSIIDMAKDTIIHKISIRELCIKAGINRSTFYRYYGSQYDLINEMQNELIDRIESRVKSDVTENRYDQLVYSVLYVLNEDVAMSRFLLIDYHDNKFYERLYARIQPEWFILNSNSDFPEHLTEYVYRGYCTGIDEIVRLWIMKDDREDTTEMTNLILKMRNRVFNS
jgi:AcrR family transcriptional regulator